MWINKTNLMFWMVCCILISCKEQPEHKDQAITIGTKKVDRLPYYNTADFTPSWLPSDDELKMFHKIPDFKFTNQLGNDITNKELHGYIYVANFFFTTCPSVCVKLTNNMHKLQEAYTENDDIKFISHTVFPSFDTVEVLQEYGERFHINPEKWYLVTGEEEEIYNIAREAYFADDTYKQTQDKNGFIHTENLILIDKEGHIRGVYKGTLPEEIARIQRHIEILRREYDQ